MTQRLVNNNPSSVTAVDVCILVSGTNTMPSSIDKLIQQLSSDLDNQFIAAGVGNKAGNRNRFCLIQFGAKNGNTRARLIRVDGSEFFISNNVNISRSELSWDGYVADGYEALEYTINNVPFRDNLSVQRGIVLITDTGRSVLADRVNLTDSVLLRLLEQSNITLDVIANLTVGSDEEEHFLGLLDYQTKVFYKEGLTHVVENEEVNITSAHGNTLTSYAELAFRTGGGAWLLGPLYDSARTTSYSNHLEGFAIGYVSSRSYLQSNVCELCLCATDKEDRPSLSCKRASNQRSCLQCLGRDEQQVFEY